MRIVSLIASATEVVAALGFADQLVAVSHECDWPPAAVEGRPVVTRPKIDVARRSLDIHKDVEVIVTRGLGVYEIDTAALRAAKPDLIITQDQCEVCAVTREDVIRATQQCLDSEVEVVTLHPDSLDDIFDDILKVGSGLKVEEQAMEYVERLREKMENVAHQTENLKPKPRVICLEWLNPLMAAGNWMPQLVTMAGGINGITRDGDHTKVITHKELAAFKPDLIFLDLIMPDMEGSMAAHYLRADPELKNIPIVYLTATVTQEEVGPNGGVINGEAFLAKPVTTKQLSHCIANHLSE